jgi:hypothetical protein
MFKCLIESLYFQFLQTVASKLMHFWSRSHESQKTPVSFVMSVHCLSVCPPFSIRLHVAARMPVRRFKWKLILGTVKIVKNVGQFTWRSKCVLLLPLTLYCHRRIALEWNDIRLLVSPSVCPSVHLTACVTLASTDRISVKSGLRGLLWKPVEELKCSYSRGKIPGPVTEDLYFLLLRVILNRHRNALFERRFIRILH